MPVLGAEFLRAHPRAQLPLLAPLMERAVHPVGQLHEFHDGLRCEMELRKDLPDGIAGLLKIFRAAAAGEGFPVPACAILRGAVELCAKVRQGHHVSLAAFRTILDNDAIEPFAAIEEALRQIEVGARDEAEGVEMFLHTQLRLLDALPDLHLLLAGEQRHPAHLFQIHPYRILAEIALCFPRLLRFLGILPDLAVIDVRGVDDLDLQALEPTHGRLHFTRIGHVIQ